MGPSAKLVFVRHGETDWNVTKRLQGQWTGHPSPTLTERGCAQAAQLAKYLAAKYPEAERIVSSDLLRARQVQRPISSLPEPPTQLCVSFHRLP
jgi:broad specificity phosphatase PhoE